jgi:stage IV sporulation protein FB
MGWQDRDYNRIGDARFHNPIMNILLGSVPLGTWFGIRVRIHSTLLIWFAFDLIMAYTKYGYGLERTLTRIIVLFSIILLHEFGHCIGARMVGGDADEILLWPLGGLAYAHPPHRPWPTFFTVAAGPLVNVIICLITGGALIAMGHFDVSWLNPFIAFGGTMFISPTTYELLHPQFLVGWLFWFFTTSSALFFFNLLPIFPLDGGQMFQSILWKPLGYYRSMMIACTVGMVGAAIGFILGILSMGWSVLVFLSIAGFITCYQRRLITKMHAASGDDVSDQYDLSAAWEHPDHPQRKKLKKRWIYKARKKAREEQAEQARIDTILAKVKDKGLHSLTWWEKRALKKATERQRERDLAERL